MQERRHYYIARVNRVGGSGGKRGMAAWRSCRHSDGWGGAERQGKRMQRDGDGAVRAEVMSVCAMAGFPCFAIFCTARMLIVIRLLRGSGLGLPAGFLLEADERV